jgi:hypothetical protein
MIVNEKWWTWDSEFAVGAADAGIAPLGTCPRAFACILLTTALAPGNRRPPLRSRTGNLGSAVLPAWHPHNPSAIRNRPYACPYHSAAWGIARSAHEAPTRGSPRRLDRPCIVPSDTLYDYTTRGGFPSKILRAIARPPRGLVSLGRPDPTERPARRTGRG